MSALYLHFPYCLYKCRYCDFNSYATPRADIPQARYASALRAEMERRRALFEATGVGFYPPGTTVATVYFGGGTPSLMEPGRIAEILAGISRHFRLTPDAEVTLEANPGTVSKDRLRAFRSAGVNRLSIGVQSFHDRYLSPFGRIHTADEAVGAVSEASEAGFTRVSGDLIFGFPDETLAEWEADLHRAVGLGLAHLSCYALTSEEGTAYTQDLGTGKLPAPDADTVADMQVTAYERLEAVGLAAYEISNFAVAGTECRHNLAYWRYQTYLGLGAGACGQFFAGGRGDACTIRQVNHKTPEHYLRSVAGGGDFFTEERIGRETALGEALMMGLRTAEGVNLGELSSRFGADVNEPFAPFIERHVAAGYLVREGPRLRPTRAGFLFHNTVVRDFLIGGCPPQPLTPSL